MNSVDPKCVLFAGNPNEIDTVGCLLPSNVRLQTAYTILDAGKLITAHAFAVIIVCINFDEAQIFPLLQLIRNSSKNANTTVFCFRSSISMVHISHRTMCTAIKAMGANDYFDVSLKDDDEFRDRLNKSLNNVMST